MAWRRAQPASARVKISESTRLRVAYRHDYRCALCRELLRAEFEVDHIVALCLGGHPTHVNNLQPLCCNCHAFKSCEDVRRYKAQGSEVECGGCGQIYSMYFFTNHLRCRAPQPQMPQTLHIHQVPEVPEVPRIHQCMIDSLRHQ